MGTQKGTTHGPGGYIMERKLPAANTHWLHATTAAPLRMATTVVRTDESACDIPALPYLR